MKRTFATLGVIGLGLISLTAPAFAAEAVYICHATGSATNPYRAVDISRNGLNGHDRDSDDIIPPNPLLPAGRNWPAGMADYYTYCAPPPAVVDPPVVVVDPPVVVVDPPVVVVDPPVVVVDPPVVVVDPPEVVPPAVVAAAVVPPAVIPPAVVPPAAKTPAPKAAAAKAPAAAAAPVSQGTNQGFNAQTAVGGGADTAPTWLAGLGLMLGAGAVVAIRRRSLDAQAD